MKRLLPVFLPLLLVSAASAQDFPKGPGEADFEKVCGGCHGADVVFTMHNSEGLWKDIVGDMVTRGADANEETVKTIVGYLAKYFGPAIEVNKAPATQLATDLGVTSQEADAIVKYRTDKGNFKAWDDLSKVPGLDAKKIEPLKNRLTY